MYFKSNDLSAFTCDTLVFGVSYWVTYTRPIRGDRWEAVVDYSFIEKTFFSHDAKPKDIKALYYEVKRIGKHTYPANVTKTSTKTDETYVKCEALFQQLSSQGKQKLIDDNILFASTDRIMNVLKIRNVKLVIKTDKYEVENHC